MTALIQIGLGPWGRDWATTILPQLADAEMVGWVDPDARARADFIASAGVPPETVFGSIGEAVAATGAVAAIAPVAIPAHEAVVRECLAQGLHTLIEKPFSERSDVARELAAEAAQKGLVLAVDQNYRLFPGAVAMRRLLADGVVGSRRHITLTWHREHGGVRASDPLVELAVHHFDLMRYLLADEASAITVVPIGIGDGAGLRVVVEFAGGDVVDYALTSSGPAPATPWTGCWEIVGDDGVLRWGQERADGGEPDPHRVSFQPRGAEPEDVDVPALPLFERAGVLRSFLDAIVGGGRPTSPADDNARTIAILEAAVASRARRTRAEVSRW
ncbi:MULTISPECIES: Gfo/Idh/MocA family protein [Bacteria]|uniref:Gfo/Idh/MocA family protein n=1 Tax=Bacteria TaxID=2 RepID=UPI003C7C0C45